MADDEPEAERLELDIQSLVRHHHGDVYRYAFRLAGNQADAEDLTQQTFLVAQQRLHQVRHPERALGWLFAVLRSCYLKNERKRRPVDAAGLELDIESIPEDVTENDIDSQLLQAAIDDLPEDSRLVVVMFYFEGCSYKEIAAQLDIPVGTVMSRLARAKGRLRKQLLPAETATDRRNPGDRERGFRAGVP
jgi:RNA polymerase sigma-70 factor (ECF subfamily)